jgi:hypothetical protein
MFFTSYSGFRPLRHQEMAVLVQVYCGMKNVYEVHTLACMSPFAWICLKVFVQLCQRLCACPCANVSVYPSGLFRATQYVQHSQQALLYERDRYGFDLLIWGP